jgi:hypothetical protein
MRELSETEKDVIKELIEWEYILNAQPHNPNQIGIDILFKKTAKKFNSSFEIDFTKNDIE